MDAYKRSKAEAEMLKHSDKMAKEHHKKKLEKDKEKEEKKSKS